MPTHSSDVRISVYGHPSAQPESVADLFGATYSTDSALTLYAKWTALPTFTVTYNSNGGTGTMTDANSPYPAGATVTVLANIFTRTGYSFAGWYPAADGSGTVYGANFTMGSANTTLYAKWTADPINGDCGISNGDSFTVIPDTNLCKTGTPTSVTGTGPWSWSCTGSNLGTDASCSATLKTLTITASATIGGSITPAGNISVNYNLSDLNILCRNDRIKKEIRFQ